MSGSNNGGWSGGGVEAGPSCETLSQQTVLNSPNRNALRSVKKGDELDVTVNKSGRAPVVHALHNGQVVGSITSAIIQRLVECIEEGHEYVAEVTENVQGGACKVLVRIK